jgi:hypothetical protein
MHLCADDQILSDGSLLPEADFDPAGYNCWYEADAS